MKAICLIYDIPQTSDFENPSWFLRRFGVRLNLSCWMIPLVNIPTIRPILDEMTAANVSWRMIKFDESESAQIKEAAIKAINDETARIHANLILTLQRASNRLEESNREAVRLHSLGEGEKAQKRYAATVERNLKTASDAFFDAVRAAEHFDLTWEVADLFEALEKAIKAERDAFIATFSTTEV